MSTTVTATVVDLAQQRDATEEGGDAAVTTLRTLMRGTATQAERKARNLLALRTAGLVGSVTPVDLGIPARAITAQRAEVLADLAEGWSYTEMAQRQHRNVATVKAHCGNLYRLFGVSSRVECVVQAVRGGFLPAPVDPDAPTPRRRRSRAQG